MGKYAATRAFNSKSSQGWKDVGSSAFGPIRNASDYNTQSFLYGFDPTGLYRGYLTARDSSNYMRDYLNNRGLDWSDIKYPSYTLGFGSSGRLGSAVLSTSTNITRLYD